MAAGAGTTALIVTARRAARLAAPLRPHARDRTLSGCDDDARPSPPASARPAAGVLVRTVPVAAELPAYRPPTARRDLIAGLTVAALAVPAAMAYAEVAGLAPVAGLYALLLPAVAYALLGSSRQLIVGPEGTLSALVGAATIRGAAAAGERADAAESPPCSRCSSPPASCSPACCASAGSPTTCRARCSSATSTASWSC